MDQPEEKVITLRKPVVLGAGDNAITYEKLTLREPMAGELEKAWGSANTNAGISITLISLVAGIPRSAVQKIGQRDLKEASDYLGGFTEDGQETGPTE
ncbi:phage tail assembly protein [Cupriavidus sp. CV2]|uniref:phage tail assembly protein n=1 Tax=Cupriavidus ulmosensis TaxID=3065913 RepID=UPI00296B1C6C|nr:phage tail assembly protein [Cupriavidus sp. CV2]MDW3683952.1 phage tail assembly protein [Cupriavidus sp. CV2]